MLYLKEKYFYFYSELSHNSLYLFFNALYKTKQTNQSIMKAVFDIWLLVVNF